MQVINSRESAEARRPASTWATRAARAIGRWLRDLSTPRPTLDGLAHLNDRMLADIGVRRIDVEGARSRIVPTGLIGHEPPPLAEVRVLRRATCGLKAPADAPDELSHAA